MKSTENINFKAFKTNILRWGFSKKGLFLNSKGEWYLFSQIILILLHLIPPYPKIENVPFSISALLIIIGLATLIKGLVIALQALIDLGDNLTPLPYPMIDSHLVETNSYKKNRHPLYKGLLLISIGIFIISLSLIHLTLFFLLALILKKKAILEEERLKIKFPEYQKYIKKVPAITKKIKYFDWR